MTGTLRKSSRIHLIVDVALALTLALTGGVFAWRMFDALGEDTLEWRFSVVLTAFPAPVMFAAGRGMNNIDVNMIPELAAFYRNDASRFDPALIPDDYEGYPFTDSYSYMHFYLLYAIGWAWRLFGISFFSIHLLCIILYALMIAALYGVFRLGMGRPLSVVGAVTAAASPAYLLSSPSLRDFGKAPFMILCFLLLGVFLKHRHTRRALAAYALLYGLVAGVGYGFRQDLLIAVPAAIVSLLFFTRVEGTRPLLTRAGASALLLVVFLVVASPVMRGVRLDKGSASGQAFTQGVSEIMEDRMDFGHASYSMHHHYSDYFDFTVVNNYARRAGYTTPMQGHFTAGHGEASGKYMREVMGLVPADMFSRGLASLTALSSVNADAAREAATITQPHGDLLRRRADRYRFLGAHFERWGLVYALAALLVLSISNLRLGIAAALLCIYFGAYPSLLYEFRHFFHLAFVPYWAAGYLVSKGCRQLMWLAKTLYKKDYTALRPQRCLKKTALGVAFVAVVIVALGLTLVVLRAAQQRRMDRFVALYADAALTPVETTWSGTDDRLLLRPAEPLPGLLATATLPVFESAGEYLALSLRHTGYPLHLRILYEDKPMVDFSQWSTPQPGLTGAEGDYLFFFPVYELVWPGDTEARRGSFTGLLIPEQHRQAVKGLYRVTNSDAFSLWSFVALPEERDAFLAHKTGPFERFFATARVELRAFFGWNRRATLAGYLRLIRRYPGYAPFETRAMDYIRRSRCPEEALALWSLLLDAFPHVYMAAAADVDTLLEQVGVDIEETPHLAPADPWSLTRRGLQLEKEGRFEEAADLYRAALAEAPNLMFAAENLDNYLQQRQDAAARIAAWDAIRMRHPEAGLPELFYGMALRGAGQLDAAAACFEAMIENRPGYSEDAQLQLAATNIMRGGEHAGMALLMKTLEEQPEKRRTAATACNEAGRYLMGQGSYDEAAAVFGMACDFYQDDLWSCVARGEALAAAGNVTEARETYIAILLQAPESPYTAHHLDALYEDDAASRIERWRMLTETHPGAAVPRAYLGRAYEAAGEAEAALEAYTEALRLNPSLDDARAGVERLNSAAASEGR